MDVGREGGMEREKSLKVSLSSFQQCSDSLKFHPFVHLLTLKTGISITLQSYLKHRSLHRLLIRCGCVIYLVPGMRHEHIRLIMGMQSMESH